jgi:membrane-bound ClpP family serine protease
MNLVSRTITGIVAVILGLILIIIGFFTLVTLIYGIPILIIGLLILFNKKEDEIEPIKIKTRAKGGKR